MSKDTAKARADAEQGHYNPPQHSCFDTGLLDSREKIRETTERKHEYREAYYEKKNEMEKRR